MTPLALEMLLRRYLGEVIFDDGFSPAEKDALGLLVGDDLMTTDRYVTERGQAYIAMILETPMPVQQWIDPRTIVTLRVNGKPIVSEPVAPKRGRGRPRKVPVSEPVGYEKQGAGYDAGAVGHELVGRAKAPETPKIPKGFTLWEPGEADATGKVAPPDFGLAPTAPIPDVTVIWRNGTKRKGPPIAFIWAQKGLPTDIVAYRQDGVPS